MLANASSVTKNGNWEEYDIFSSKLWPHESDLVGRTIEDAHAAGIETTGTVSWQDIEVTPGQRHSMPVLENATEAATSSLRVRLNVMDKDRVVLPLNEPYMLAVRARAQDLHAQSRYFARIYYDNSPMYAMEAFSSFDQKKVTYLEEDGFLRDGSYGFVLPGAIQDHIIIEIGLSGVGRLEIADPQFL